MFFSVLFLSLGIVCTALSFKVPAAVTTIEDFAAPPPPVQVVYLNMDEQTLLDTYRIHENLPPNFVDLPPSLQIALMQHFENTDKLQKAKADVPDLSHEPGTLDTVPAKLLAGYVDEANRFMEEVCDTFRQDLQCSMQTPQPNPQHLFHAHAILATVGRAQVQELLTKINAQARATRHTPLYESPLQSASTIVQTWFEDTTDSASNPAIEKAFPGLAVPLTRAHQSLYTLFFVYKALIVKAHLHPQP